MEANANANANSDQVSNADELDWKVDAESMLATDAALSDVDDPVIARRFLVLSISLQDYGPGFKQLFIPGVEVDVKNVDTLLRSYGATNYKLIRNSETLVRRKRFDELVASAVEELTQNEDAYDAFLFFFSGHGLNDGPYSSMLALAPDTPESPVMDVTASHFVHIQTLLNRFSNRQTHTKQESDLGDHFLGKPKIFVIDACRGGGHAHARAAPAPEQTAVMAATQPTLDAQLFPQLLAVVKPPSELYHPDANLILLQSNTQGFASFRDANHGCWLRYCVCWALNARHAVVHAESGVPRLSFDDAVYLIRHQLNKIANEIGVECICVLTSTAMTKLAFEFQLKAEDDF